MNRAVAILAFILAGILLLGATMGTLVVGKQMFVVDSTGNIKRLRGLAYSWPTSHAEGYLKNNGTGGMSWDTPAGGSGTPSESVVYETSFGLTPGAGAASSYSRGDHTHGTMAAPSIPSGASTVTAETSYGQSSSAGGASTYSKGDHTHGTPTALTPAASVVSETTAGQSPVVGTSLAYARQDHTHGTPAGGGADPWTQYRLGANQTNATTTLASITGLGHTLAASKDYEMECRLIVWSSVTTTGVQPSVLGPTSPTEVVWHARVPYTATTEFFCHYRAYSTKCAALTALTTGQLLTIWAIVRNNASTGTLTPQFAAETTGTVTVGTGSICRYRQTN